MLTRRGHSGPRHPCPCCGYKTLPGRADYDLCPVCWWEDDGDLEPWKISGPNGQTLVEAQQEYAAETRPYWRRPGKVRAPRRREARDPDWRPYEPTPDLMARVRRANEAERLSWEEERQRVAQEIADDPEGPFKEYNAAMQSLIVDAADLPHGEVKSRLRLLGQKHEFLLPEAYLEMQARLTKDEDFYRDHPAHAALWLLRHSRPGTYRRHWLEMRTGTFHVAG
jgi:hypothetical protein